LEWDAEGVLRKYTAKHLEFRSSVIEPLPDDGIFEVETPAGTFRMTKAEFHAAFPEIVSSVSYRDRGAYYYPKLPYKVFRFLVWEKKLAAGSAAQPSDGRTVSDPGIDQIESSHEEGLE
jgi:hypothetical protein